MFTVDAIKQLNTWNLNSGEKKEKLSLSATWFLHTLKFLTKIVAFWPRKSNPSNNSAFRCIWLHFEWQRIRGMHAVRGETYVTQIQRETRAAFLPLASLSGSCHPIHRGIGPFHSASVAADSLSSVCETAQSMEKLLVPPGGLVTLVEEVCQCLKLGVNIQTNTKTLKPSMWGQSWSTVSQYANRWDCFIWRAFWWLLFKILNWKLKWSSHWPII